MEADKAEEPIAAAQNAETEADSAAGVQTNGSHDLQESAAGKRGREDDEGEDEALKRSKTEGSMEEVRPEEAEKEGEKEEKIPIKLGPKTFGTSVEMFDYFYKLLHAWSPNLELNKYEELVMTELLQRGHNEPEKKIGAGIRSFEVRYHPQFKSRCFFLVRSDGSSDDFSFRKCVDRILPLPDSMKVSGGGKGGGGRGRGGGGGGRGRGGGGGGWGKRGGH